MPPMRIHPNQRFAMSHNWQPDLQRLSEALRFKCAVPASLSAQWFESDWFAQKLAEYRFEHQQRVDEYLDPIKRNEYDWTLDLAIMLKNSYQAAKRIEEKIQLGQLERRQDPQHNNIQQLLKQTEPTVQQASKPSAVPENVDTEQLDRMVQFAYELNGRKPLPSQIDTWANALASMEKSQQTEQVNYAISIGKTVIYPPRQPYDLSRFSTQQQNPPSAAEASSKSASPRQQHRQAESDKHQLNLQLNGIQLTAKLDRQALSAFLDERFAHEHKAMSNTRLQALVNLLAKMTLAEQAEAVQHAIIGNYKTIYPPRRPATDGQSSRQAHADRNAAKRYNSVRETGRAAAAEIERELQQNRATQKRSFTAPPIAPPIAPPEKN